MPAVIGQRYPGSSFSGGGGGSGLPSPLGPEGSIVAIIGGDAVWASIVTDTTSVLVDGLGNVILVEA